MKNREVVLLAGGTGGVAESFSARLAAEGSGWSLQVLESAAEAVQRIEAGEVDLVCIEGSVAGCEILGGRWASFRRRFRTAVAVLPWGTRLPTESAAPSVPVLPSAIAAGRMSEAMDRAVALHRRLNTETLEIVLHSGADVPWAVPSTRSVLARLSRPGLGAAGCAAAVASDAAIAARVVELANVVFFDEAPLVDLEAVARRTGVGLLRALVLASALGFSAHPGEPWAASQPPRGGAVSGCRDDCQVAAALAEIGKVLMRSVFAEEYGRFELGHAIPDEVSLRAERLLFGVAHPEVGAHLLQQVGAPIPLVEAVAERGDTAAKPCRVRGTLGAPALLYDPRPSA